METFEDKFAHFVVALKKEAGTTWTEVILEQIKKAMVESRLDSMYICQMASPKKKKVSGYNLYLKERMLQLRKTDIDSNHRMQQISEEWKKMDATEKEAWKTKAKNLAAPEPVKLRLKLKKRGNKKEKRNTKWSGYQLFVSENMNTLGAEIKPKDRMTEIGKRWKSLDETNKGEYKKRASEGAGQVVPTPPADPTTSVAPSAP